MDFEDALDDNTTLSSVNGTTAVSSVEPAAIVEYVPVRLRRQSRQPLIALSILTDLSLWISFISSSHLRLSSPRILAEINNHDFVDVLPYRHLRLFRNVPGVPRCP